MDSIRIRFSRVDWTYETIFLIGVLGAAAFALSLAGRRAGWSIGQTEEDPYLVQIYAAHFRHGDLFPVWSSSDAHGMGTPVLLYYQKVFFMAGGLVFIILGGALKATMVVTVAIFMVIGAYGMRKALGMVTDSRLLQAVGSIGFLLTNWAFAEWLVRADLAEFSAFMIVPWLLYWCLTLVRDRRLSWSIVPIMLVLVDAHNFVALLSIITLAVTGVIFLASYGLRGLRDVALRFVVATVVIALILAPMVVAEIKMGKYYDPASVVIYENSLISSLTFAHPSWFLFDPSYHWLSGGNVQRVSSQLDFGITILLFLGLFTLPVLWVRKFIRHVNSGLPRVNRPVVAVLVVSLAIYMILQLRISLGVYNSVWQLRVGGYPFRMMSFAVPLALLLAILVADWYLRVFRIRRPNGSSWVPAVLAAFWLASFVLLSPVTAHESPALDGLYVPIQALTAPPHVTFQSKFSILLFPEYLPKVVLHDGSKVPYDTPLYDRLHQVHHEAESLSSVPCSVVQTSGTAFESLRIGYTVTCEGETQLALPISYNPFTSVEERGKGGLFHPVATFHVPTDPRIIVDIHNSGTHTLMVDLPTLGRILF